MSRRIAILVYVMLGAVLFSANAQFARAAKIDFCERSEIILQREGWFTKGIKGYPIILNRSRDTLLVFAAANSALQPWSRGDLWNSVKQRGVRNVTGIAFFGSTTSPASALIERDLQGAAQFASALVAQAALFPNLETVFIGASKNSNLSFQEAVAAIESIFASLGQLPKLKRIEMGMSAKRHRELVSIDDATAKKIRTTEFVGQLEALTEKLNTRGVTVAWEHDLMGQRSVFGGVVYDNHVIVDETEYAGPSGD